MDIIFFKKKNITVLFGAQNKISRRIAKGIIFWIFFGILPDLGRIWESDPDPKRNRGYGSVSK